MWLLNKYSLINFSCQDAWSCAGQSHASERSIDVIGSGECCG